MNPDKKPEVGKVFLCVNESCGWMGGTEKLRGSAASSSEEVHLPICPICGSKVETIRLPKGEAK